MALGDRVLLDEVKSPWKLWDLVKVLQQPNVIHLNTYEKEGQLLDDLCTVWFIRPFHFFRGVFFKQTDRYWRNELNPVWWLKWAGRSRGAISPFPPQAKSTSKARLSQKVKTVRHIKSFITPVVQRHVEQCRSGRSHYPTAGSPMTSRE